MVKVPLFSKSLMRARALFFLLLILGLFFLLDWSVVQNLLPLFHFSENNLAAKLIQSVYWSINIGLPIFMILSFLFVGRSKQLTARLGSIFITLFFTKIIFLIGLLFGETINLLDAGISNIIYPENNIGIIINHELFKSQLALGFAVIPFFLFIYGITKGKYRYTVHRHTLYFKDLPPAFDGFTITQISDVHSGSFHNKKAVEKGIDLINKQASDLFIFTGDLVNNSATEIEPWIDSFKTIKAPYGQYSILGNHDYGDYVTWPTPEAKSANMQRLKQHHAAIGFRLLLDEHIILEKEGQKIALLGVENWGIGFGKRGNLGKALHNIPPGIFKILLSHDPSHWDHEVRNHYQNINLTFSGHTHGMQLGIEIFGWKWSPVKFRYPKWAGLYEENSRYLYVNRGFGFLGFAGRVGIWPEVTVVTLKREI